MTPRNPKKFVREERRVQVVTAFAIQIAKGEAQYWTCAQIAKKIGMVRSSHLDRILRDMVAAGMLTMRECQRPGRQPGYEYMLTDGTYELPKPRTINLKVNGKQEGQLELW
jgi:hypothetical protein